MSDIKTLGTSDLQTSWLSDPTHRHWLMQDANAQFGFFKNCMRDTPGFHVLDTNGAPREDALQELHSTTRMVHSFALGQLLGVEGSDAIVNHGMDYLLNHHRDPTHDGYVWALNDSGVVDGRKMAYGHVFVLLAGSSAKIAGHPDGDTLIQHATKILNDKFWDDALGRFVDEFNRDWTPFSTYRGMNANMHGVEALLTAYEATGEEDYLEKAGRILSFFVKAMAPAHDWRLPEHFTETWEVDPSFEGNPMFRPGGTTPGHSFEFARLLLQHWDLCGRPADNSPQIARQLFERAYADALDETRGGLIYTVHFDGQPKINDRYWWPVTEAIGTLASFLKLEWSEQDETRYRALWHFAHQSFIDHEKGGWFPEVDENNKPTSTQFPGKPDIYHALQASLFPLSSKLSGIAEDLKPSA